MTCLNPPEPYLVPKAFRFKPVAGCLRRDVDWQSSQEPPLAKDSYPNEKKVHNKSKILKASNCNLKTQVAFLVKDTVNVRGQFFQFPLRI